ncbi:MAG: adaptor protein MecA [Bacillus sp. (in: firmicutes)]
MKLVRLDENKLKIYLTGDDLCENGLTVEDLKNGCLKVHAIIQQLVEGACEEVDFQLRGAVDIEIFSLHAQGLVMVVTRDEDVFAFWGDDYEDFLDLQWSVAERQQALYEFLDIEDVIHFCKALQAAGYPLDSRMYHFDLMYFLCLESIPSERYDAVVSLAAEFGSASTYGYARVIEYGKEILPKKAVEWINQYF